MFEKLLRVRYVAVIIVAFSFLNAVGFTVLGVRTAIHAYANILQGNFESTPSPGLEMLESMDRLFIALMFIIFTAGIAKVFLASNLEEERLPAWLRIKSFSELKHLLWETGLTALFILLFPLFIRQGQNFDQAGWTFLVLPASVLLLSICMYLMKKH